MLRVVCAAVALLLLSVPSQASGIRWAKRAASSLADAFGFGPAKMPVACVPSPNSPVAASNTQFQIENANCLKDFDDCITSNRSACAATCDSNLGTYGYDCRAGNGAFCRYQAFSHSGSVTNDRPFVMRSAICLPAGCGRDQTVQVEAFLRQQRCGPLANSLDCQLTLTCDFGLTSGAIIGIVAGVVFGFCAIVAGGVCCSHNCDEDEEEDLATSDDRNAFRMPSFILETDDESERGARRSSSVAEHSQGQRRVARGEWNDSDDGSDSIGSIVGEDYLLESRNDEIPDKDGL